MNHDESPQLQCSCGKLDDQPSFFSQGGNPPSYKLVYNPH